MEKIEKEREKQRPIGRYVLRERTARRLVATKRRRPLIAIGLMWVLFLLLITLVTPWRGGARLFIAVASGVVLLLVSLLVLYSTPVQRQIVVDMETSFFQIARRYFFPRRASVLQIPLRAVSGVRRRRQVWGDPGEVERTEWMVDLVGTEGGSWIFVEGEEEEPSAELARLVAEVSGRPLEGPA
jgi:uncharacterized protein YhhL (DUF1145 family)